MHKEPLGYRDNPSRHMPASLHKEVEPASSFFPRFISCSLLWRSLSYSGL